MTDRTLDDIIRAAITRTKDLPLQPIPDKPIKIKKL